MRSATMKAERAPRRASGQDRPSAVLCGDLNMLRCFADTGVKTLVVSRDPEDLTFASRHCRARRTISDPHAEPEAALRDLVRIGQMHADKPTLFYGDDAMLRLVSRRRDVLGAHFRFLLPPPEQVEDLVDKTRFARLAAELSLPVPKTLLASDVRDAEDVLRSIKLPCIVKPHWHVGWFQSRAVQLAGAKPFKALQADTLDELRALLEVVREFSERFVIQELVPGEEDQIYSFHAYVDQRGEVLGHYVGKKIRTYPRRAGTSTYLELVRDPDLEKVGRDVLERLRFRGVVKLDFKRDARDGRFVLLEVNPRFSLWNHLGAACGVNLPLIAHRDLVGEPRERSAGYRTGVRWLSLGSDARSFVRDYRSSGDLGLVGWLRSLRGPKVYDVFAPDDALPALLLLARNVQSRTSKASRRLWAAGAGLR